MNEILPFIAPTLGIVAAVIAGLFANRARVTEHRLSLQREELRRELSDEERRREFDENVVRQLEEPLLYAASDLQSRLWKILKPNAQPADESERTARQHTDDVEYTAFLFAQYFGWAESMRRAALMSEMARRGSDDVSVHPNATSSIAASIREINDALSTDADGAQFLLFSSEQHAIGELMMRWPEGARLPTVERYAGFARRLRHDPILRGWLTPLIDGLNESRDPVTQRRLAIVQNELVDLIAKIPNGTDLYKVRRKTPIPGPTR